MLSTINLKKKLLLFILIPAISLISIFDNGKKERMITKSINSIKTGQFSIYHSGHYETAWKMFLDKKILGHGPKAFRYLCSESKFRVIDQTDKNSVHSCSTHPHNTYMQLLSETGLFGFSIVFFIFIYLCYMLLKLFLSRYLLSVNLKKNYNSNIAIILGLFVYLWPISPHGNFFNNWLSILLYSQLFIFFLVNSNFLKLNKK